MCTFEKETVLIRPHVGQSILGQPHEPRQQKTKGPQQEINKQISTYIAFCM